jgi:hypothetical protein
MPDVGERFATSWADRFVLSRGFPELVPGLFPIVVSPVEIYNRVEAGLEAAVRFQACSCESGREARIPKLADG